jgi:hypothetical protein
MIITNPRYILSVIYHTIEGLHFRLYNNSLPYCKWYSLFQQSRPPHWSPTRCLSGLSAHWLYVVLRQLETTARSYMDDVPECLYYHHWDIYDGG